MTPPTKDSAEWLTHPATQTDGGLMWSPKKSIESLVSWPLGASRSPDKSQSMSKLLSKNCLDCGLHHLFYNNDLLLVF